MVRQRRCSAILALRSWYSFQETGFSASQSEDYLERQVLPEKFPEHVGFVGRDGIAEKFKELRLSRSEPTFGDEEGIGAITGAYKGFERFLTGQSLGDAVDQFGARHLKLLRR
jgi:hypothetical protein